MAEHELKCWPEPFEAICNDTKTAEYRRDDRGFLVGDVLVLREWDPNMRSLADGQRGEYTGLEIHKTVTHIARGPDWGIPKGFVVLSLRPDGRVRRY